MKTVGYIVLCNGRAMWCESRKFALDTRGVLYHGYAATIFATRRHAERAIRRTVEYATHRGYDWGRGYTIQRVEQWTAP